MQNSYESFTNSSPKIQSLISITALMRRYVLLTILLFFLFHSVVFSELSLNQRTTMITLSELVSTTASPWRIANESNPCSWKGVQCSPDNSSVTHLSFSGFAVYTSDFLPVVCKLDSLQYIDVSNNQLSLIPDGFISDCGGINGLKLLNFSRNKLIGNLPRFNGFVGLQFLDLSHNYMNGSIDFQLDGLVGLKSLNLSNNMFNGSVPIHLGKSKVLEQLELSSNNFQGVFPEEIVDYGNLTMIDLSENKLSGPLPTRIGQLSKLEVLILSSNDLAGVIPNTLSNITTLARFAAYENSFHGSIPSGISKYLRNLDLSFNQISGLIPLDLLSQPNLIYVDLSYNLLMGSIPANISSSLVRLRLGSNDLSDVIPPTTLKTLDKLTYLELENNSLTGFLPPEVGFCKSLALLSLGQNQLNGTLPAELGNLTHLQALKLQLNKLSGEIPIQITQLLNLSTLNISGNYLSGSIPSAIQSLQKLTNLDLQGNNLSGSIPDTIGSLNSLIELQLGHNKLSGLIPPMPQKLQISLNLSSNLLEGPIPETFSLLTRLEVLDLSDNNLSGEIPTFLTHLDALTKFLIYNNRLTGIIPEFRANLIFNISGNPGLVYGTRTPNSYPEVAKKKKSVAVPIAAAIAAAVVVVGIATVIFLSILRRYYKVNDEQVQSVEELPLSQVIQGDLMSANAIHRSNIDFAKAMEAVAIPSNIVLKTRFSTYYKATMPSGTSYFIKKLNWSDKIFQLGNRDKFGQELEAIAKLSNSNVMIPLAYILTAQNAYIFYEYAQKGVLFDVLHGSSENTLDWGSRYSIAIGVAQGLAFLHGCSSGPILLFDLSSSSIMLKSVKEPQVGDIELSRVINPSKSAGSLSTVAGSVGYIPPEYAYTMRVTMAGNIYSFGVILLELLTGKPAVSGGTELAKWAISNSEQQDKWDYILDSNISRTSLTVRNQMLAVLKIALSCVSISPKARPKMKSVLRMLLTAR